MKLIAGLGNPGKRYEHTRHNVGFMVLDALAKDLGVTFKNNKELGVSVASIDGAELIKPQKFMNNSGLIVRTIAKKRRIQAEDILVVMDDMDLELGKLRYREIGSSGGHKGLQSIIDQMKTNIIQRLKIGIGRPDKVTAEEYVTANFTGVQLSQIKKTLPIAVRTIREKFLKLEP